MSSKVDTKWWCRLMFENMLRHMKRHIGAIKTMGRVAVTSFFRKQKINGKRLTAELTGVDNALIQILWAKYFLQCQGFKGEENIVFNSNNNTMVLEKNGRAFNLQRTR